MLKESDLKSHTWGAIIPLLHTICKEAFNTKKSMPSQTSVKIKVNIETLGIGKELFVFVLEIGIQGGIYFLQVNHRDRFRILAIPRLLGRLLKGMIVLIKEGDGTISRRKVW